MTTTLAYRSDPALRASMIAMAEAHRDADDYGAGTYGDPSSRRACAIGCAIGCAIRDCITLGLIPANTKQSDHTALAAIGIPPQIAHLIDVHFERSSISDRTAWTPTVFASIPCGADLTLAWPRFAVRMLSRLTVNAGNRTAIDAVRVLYQRTIDGDRPTDKEFARAAWDAGAARAAGAAWVTGDAGAARAAWAAELAIQRADLLDILATSQVPATA